MLVEAPATAAGHFLSLEIMGNLFPVIMRNYFPLLTRPYRIQTRLQRLSLVFAANSLYKKCRAYLGAPTP
jgi:hypothetical protein